ncbi:glycosyltransferase family 4 protein [Ruficoccus amylovorans]|uniref:Glycosyltransferase family 4 protein n=1 Tax=Ruficoccus amylovorans TaxID=1804625 RepID=A0A842HG11_9BACT|nr:glycosyltransferase family 4 protein [Ruficoccus amylovorans]MBC2595615.1 glycosyltransferase family 4 protein [Ruficoccus amylovorans]
MKILLSSGQGRLRFPEFALALVKAGFDVRLITGYVPRHTPAFLLNGIGRLLKKPDLHRRLMLRCPAGLARDQIDCCTGAEILEGIRQMCQQLHLPIWSDTFTWKAFARQSLKYIHDADILHLRSGAGGAGVIEKVQQRGIKVVVAHSIAHPTHIRDNLAQEAQHWPDSKASYHTAFWQLVEDDCKRADAILVNSEYVKKSLQQYGLQDKPIHVIHGPVSRKFAVTHERSHTPNRLRLIFTGSFDMRKGARLLLRAMQQLHEQYPGISLDVYGTVSLPPDWLSQCEAANIHMHGHVSHDILQQALAEADLFAFPTLSEGCARSVMEAMAAGLPVLTTEDSGAPIEHLKNGYLLETGSIDSLVEGILYAYNHWQEARQWGQQAATEVAERYTEENFALQLKAFYEQLLKS